MTQQILKLIWNSSLPVSDQKQLCYKENVQANKSKLSFWFYLLWSEICWEVCFIRDNEKSIWKLFVKKGYHTHKDVYWSFDILLFFLPYIPPPYTSYTHWSYRKYKQWLQLQDLTIESSSIIRNHIWQTAKSKKFLLFKLHFW